VAGFNYVRSTSHGIQNVHKGFDVVPTGPDDVPYPRGTMGCPIHALDDYEVLAVWDNGSVGGYRQAIVVHYPRWGVDVLYGHVLRGSMQPAGHRGEFWDVVAKVGTQYDGLGPPADAHTHVQVAPSSTRSSWIRTLGEPFNRAAIDPGPIRLQMGEPRLSKAVPYYGPAGSTIAAYGAGLSSEFVMGEGEPNLDCGDHA
jgi:hypothetical protein